MGAAVCVHHDTRACWAGDTMFLYGGHTVEIDPSDKSETEIVHDDVWALDLLAHQVGVSQWCGASRALVAAQPCFCKQRCLGKRAA